MPATVTTTDRLQGLDVVDLRLIGWADDVEDKQGDVLFEIAKCLTAAGLRCARSDEGAPLLTVAVHHTRGGIVAPDLLFVAEIGLYPAGTPLPEQEGEAGYQAFTAGVISGDAAREMQQRVMDLANHFTTDWTDANHQPETTE